MSDWKQPTTLLYAFSSHPGGVILQDYESCVLYLYVPFPLLLFNSSHYAFQPINLSLSAYFYKPQAFAGRLVCSFIARQPTFLISPHLWDLDVGPARGTHDRLRSERVKGVHCYTYESRVRHGGSGEGTFGSSAQSFVQRLHNSLAGSLFRVDASPYGCTGVRGQYVRNLSLLYRGGASYFCLSHPLWWNMSVCVCV